MDLYLTEAAIPPAISGNSAADNIASDTSNYDPYSSLCFTCLDGFLKWFVILPLLSAMMMIIPEITFLGLYARKFISYHQVRIFFLCNFLSSVFVIAMFVVFAIVFGPGTGDLFYSYLFFAFVFIALYYSNKIKQRLILSQLRIPEDINTAKRMVFFANILAFIPPCLVMLFWK